jgi:seryl-tRNA synthetase
MERGSASPVDQGLVTLRGSAVALRDALERRFVAWAGEAGAESTVYPPLLDVEALDRLDYFDNFPHLALAVSGIAAPDRYVGKPHVHALPGEDLDPARYMLPSAACFGVYIDLSGQTLTEPRYVTTAANCFRREQSFDGMRRLLGFYMREIVCVGEREAVVEHLAASRRRIRALLEALELPAEILPASDPFYDPAASRSIMQQLFPVKEEIVYGGDLAIGSLNFHRNFFGERCDIRLADGSHAFSGCAAFGLERWMAALAAQFGDDSDRLRARVEQVLQT